MSVQVLTFNVEAFNRTSWCETSERDFAIRIFGLIFGMLPSSIEVFSKDFACQTGEVVA